MTEEQYRLKESEFDRNYDDVNLVLDKYGFDDYNDGAGDYGERRLYEDLGVNKNPRYKIKHTIIIKDMTPCYYDNEYPDYQFTHKETGQEFNTVIEFLTIINN